MYEDPRTSLIAAPPPDPEQSSAWHDATNALLQRAGAGRVRDAPWEL